MVLLLWVALVCALALSSPSLWTGRGARRTVGVRWSCGLRWSALLRHILAITVDWSRGGTNRLCPRHHCGLVEGRNERLGCAGVVGCTGMLSCATSSPSLWTGRGARRTVVLGLLMLLLRSCGGRVLRCGASLRSSAPSSSAVGGLVVGVVAWCGDVVRARVQGRRRRHWAHNQEDPWIRTVRAGCALHLAVTQLGRMSRHLSAARARAVSMNEQLT